MKVGKNNSCRNFFYKAVLGFFLVSCFLGCPLLADDGVTPQEIRTTEQNVEQIRNSYLLEDLLQWNSDKCELIDDIYLRAVCLRKQRYRPHMNMFVTTAKASSIKQQNFDDDKCPGFEDDYSKLVCRYVNAAYYAKKEPEKAHELCHRLQDEKLVGECSFYVAVSLVMSLAEDTGSKINQLMDFCGKIKNPNWRSECYFLLADELAFLELADTYLDAIVSACKHSENARDFGCFSHVAMILPYETQKQFCNIVARKAMPGCYWGMGSSFLIDSDDVNRSIERCGSIAEQPLRSFCLGGLSHYAGIDFLRMRDGAMASQLINKCMSLPLADHFKKPCVLGLGIRWGFSMSAAGGVKNCLGVAKEYRTVCFQGLSQGLPYKGGGFQTFLDECAVFPEDYQDVCFEYAVKTMGIWNRQENKNICGSFPSRFWKKCYASANRPDIN